MAGKREFLRDHEFTLTDFAVWYGTTLVIALPMFHGLLWLMGLTIGIAVPADAVLTLILLAFLLSTCVGMSVGLSLVRLKARRRSRQG